MFGFLKTLFGETKPAARARPPSPAKSAAKSAAKPAMTENRAQLLKQAQDIHRAKRQILDALSDEDRARLVSMAILTFLNDGKP